MDTSLIEDLKAAAGPSGWLESEADKAAYLTDERDLYHGATPLVLRPATTEQVSRIVALCNDAGIGVVPQGGNTGYCGGSIPGKAGDEILLSRWRREKGGAKGPRKDTRPRGAGGHMPDQQQAAP
ncbi:MAG: FAD-binding protein, partial [Pseudomonadota bacterium]